MLQWRERYAWGAACILIQYSRHGEFPPSCLLLRVTMATINRLPLLTHMHAGRRKTPGFVTAVMCYGNPGQTSVRLCSTFEDNVQCHFTFLVLELSSLKSEDNIPSRYFPLR